jgi:hypothetical protein
MRVNSMIYQGSCHCGTVQFEIDAPEHIEATNCNCSICTMAGFLHLILPLSHFRLLAGEDNITTYTFNTGVAKHTFCKTCGIKPFYTPRSNPDGIDVNVNCLKVQPSYISVTDFDGQHWEAHAHELQHFSQES